MIIPNYTPSQILLDNGAEASNLLTFVGKVLSTVNKGPILRLAQYN
ncbi:hypothetical protein CLV31_103181 [Algoriphagus aquaeductus]|uniref:Uncharacterized protein n=1 Tax=Algoriphagus aquaeductus TaxID=475299 RepID=A0A326RU78_9BACT|nr:hypothetical protein CLV31_103181 [Algoriphagus aquaeductus]